MRKVKQYSITLVFVICLLCVFFCSSALADESDNDINYTDVPVYVDGLLTCRGYEIGDCTYVSMDTICDALGYDAQFGYEPDDQYAQKKTLTIKVCDIEITVNSSDRYMCANGRCLYLPAGYMEIAGEPVFPLEAVAKIFTLDVSRDEENGTCNVDTSNKAILQSGDEFYNEEDLYWMSRIITWESGNQPLEGQIGVGNVVLNRIDSRKFPNSNTVKEVIFQSGQFDPVAAGVIYKDPFDISAVAAKLVLEGYNTVGNAIFFQVARYGEMNEFATYVTTIGGHNFFA